MPEIVTFSSRKKEYGSLSNFWKCDIIINYFSDYIDEIARDVVGRIRVRTQSSPLCSDSPNSYLYESGEHCFHGEKYRRIAMLYDASNQRRFVLLDHWKRFRKDCKYSGSENGGYYVTPADAKRGGGKKGLLLIKSELEAWKTISIEVQKEICKYKFDNYSEIRDDLKKSGDKILIHPAMRCSDINMNTRFWEGRVKEMENEEYEILGGNMLGNIWMEIRGNSRKLH